MKTSIATVSISGTFAEKLAAIATAGFDGIEIFEQDFTASDFTPAEVGRMVRDQGLEITLFQPFRDFEGLPEPHRARAFARAARKFDLMNQLGTDLVLVCSSVHPAAMGGIDRMAADFAELGDLAKSHGIRVGFEALAWGRHVNDHRDAWEVVRRADHPNVGLILDSFHTLGRKIDPDTIRRIPGDRIFFVQLADAPAIEMDLLYWSRHFRNMPGEGDLDVTGFMRAVMATGYSGPLSLEIFNDQFRGGSPRSIAIDGRRSLVALMDQVRRLEPDVAIETPDMPDRIAAAGIEFVEFAADADEAERLDRLFSALGFRVAGRHRTKAVTLYRQGGINLVVNTEREGFAHSSVLVRGTSAYAVGIRVDDARATVARARALGAEIFKQAPAPGGLAIPAIHGLGGGILYFIDGTSDLARVWEIEFEPVAGGPPAVEVGLTRVDHVAQTMDYEEMLSWGLFYTSIFRMKKTPMVDIVDPAGLVRSQAIGNAEGSLRLTLNGAENRRTLAGHFIAETFGSAIQHIAFATGDIFAAAAALKANGLEPLAISQNYYDDLEARFGLDPDVADRLRDENILYDRDDSGEYFQIYSPVVGEGFFFEVVERRGGYDGYGGPNAPFRIAAQKRRMRPKGMPRE